MGSSTSSVYETRTKRSLRAVELRATLALNLAARPPSFSLQWRGPPSWACHCNHASVPLVRLRAVRLTKNRAMAGQRRRGGSGDDSLRSAGSCGPEPSARSSRSSPCS